MNPQTARISIYTKPGTFIFEGCIRFYTKMLARKILHIRRGPDVVLNSLKRGLAATDVTFNLNSQKPYPLVHVLSNPKALTWAIKQKRSGNIKYLLAGPNISILPSLDNAVLTDSAIDVILLPSEWVKQVYIKDSPALEHKMRVWPSGVEIPQEDQSNNDTNSANKEYFIIFKKEYPEADFEKVTKTLDRKNILYKVLKYGTFNQKTYFSLLKNARGLIYLQKSESQGIALQEAWAHNVPTLVWDVGEYTYTDDSKSITVRGVIGAPYLTDECGMSFNNIDEFTIKFDEFVTKLQTFEPRHYCIRELSDKASVEKYLSIISEINYTQP